MFKILCLISFCATGLSSAYIVRESNLPNAQFNPLGDPLETAGDDLWSKWGPHIMEFVELINVEKVLSAALPHLNDPEVLNFIAFVSSPKFKQLIGEFEAMPEFKEALAYLKSKGYSVEPIIELINSLLDAPILTNPIVVVRGGKGISGLLEDVFAALPMDEIKELFLKKKETVPEVAELYHIINSEEFLAILKKMKSNPKFKEFKEILESYGFDFDYYCEMTKEFLGEYYQGIFCESNKQ